MHTEFAYAKTAATQASFSYPFRWQFFAKKPVVQWKILRRCSQRRRFDGRENIEGGITAVGETESKSYRKKTSYCWFWTAMETN
ncbi:MAG: hypothetical protein IPM82_20690 [Saprospiraceae bacterium]|nr:hypothetical protein [Saprospiraceae bacterium]